MKRLTPLVAAFLVPLTVINLFGEIVAGIWLICIGQWKALGLGILIHLIPTLIVGFLMLLAMLVAAPGMLAFKLGWKRLGILFGWFGYLATPAVLIGWGYLMLSVFPLMGPPTA